jgi:hypothetical protein
MSNTPETDAFFFRTDIEWDDEVEFGRKLERERDNLQDQRDFAMSEMERRGRERDKARDWVFRLRKQRAIARNFGEQMERERDEARKALREIASLDTSQDASPQQCGAVLVAMNALGL